MAPFGITLSDEKIQELHRGDRGMAVLLEPILNQILHAEMAEHLGATGPGERPDARQGYRSGSHQRQLATRVGIELEVGINETGQREIMGLETAFGETAEAGHRFIDQLKH